jgi:glycosyltransferase involved in cell wall biosynthesis
VTAAARQGSDAATVTVVITTFERPAGCERAVRSALEQEPAPLEVIICDDGSGRQTRERLRALAGEDGRIRYVWLPHRGTPGPARTVGYKSASGAWVAFLDDDDAWLPDKLKRQLERAGAGDVDVIGTNALRGDGTVYFPSAPPEWRPALGDLLRDNPLIVSSVLVRRDVLDAAGGFRTERWARGVADYGMWLALADAGARMVVLGDALVDYESRDANRMSAAPVRQEVAVARLFWLRWLERPADSARFRSAANKTVGAAWLARDRARRRLLGGRSR